MRSIVVVLCLAAAAASLLIAAPLVVPLGFGFGVILAFLSPNAPLQLIQSHPRSIFETRRAGLA